MPAFGQREGNVGLGVVPAVTSNELQQVKEFHRKVQTMQIPEEPEPIVQLSEEQKVFIYNVSPWRFQQELASYGTRTIPALDEAKCLSGELYVAGPLVIDGIPREYYPSEGEAKVIYHRPLKNRGRQSKRPGLDFAYEVIGKGMMVNPSCDLTNFGVFVSEQPEQTRPTDNKNTEAQAAYARWTKDVRDAQGKLRAKCAEMCEAANMAYARGTFNDIRGKDGNEQLYIAARLIKKTEMDCPWLKGTAEAADKKHCISCQSVLPGAALKCGVCGELQLTQEEYDKEVARRRSMTM
jgi:hypothetical protein